VFYRSFCHIEFWRQLYNESLKDIGTPRAGKAMALGTIIFVILLIATCFYFYANKKIEENY